MAKLYDGGDDVGDVSVLRLFTTLTQICINKNKLRPQSRRYIYRIDMIALETLPMLYDLRAHEPSPMWNEIESLSPARSLADTLTMSRFYC